jgi:hypothetical protein
MWGMPGAAGLSYCVVLLYLCVHNDFTGHYDLWAVACLYQSDLVQCPIYTQTAGVISSYEPFSKWRMEATTTPLNEVPTCNTLPTLLVRRPGPRAGAIGTGSRRKQPLTTVAVGPCSDDCGTHHQYLHRIIGPCATRTPPM